MLPLSLHESRRRGDAEFPVAYYDLTPSHPRYYMPFHWHQEWELIRIVRGSACFIINEQEILAQAGDVLLIAEGFLHGGRPEDPSCRYECLVFDLPALFSGVSSMKRLLADLEKPGMPPQVFYPQSRYPELTALFAQVTDLCGLLAGNAQPESLRLGLRMQVFGLFSQILGIITCEHLFETGIRPDSSCHVSQLKPVLEYIERSYGTPITLESLAALAGVSPKYFCALFRQLTQKTPMDYVILYRIEQACILLRQTGLPITEVSLRCGFNDSAYFARRFKKQTGMTPMKYRKQEIPE